LLKMGVTQTIESIIITFAFVMVFLVTALALSKAASNFLYFYVTDGAEVVGDTVSGIIMSAAGSPGKVDIKFDSPSVNYEYVIDIGEKTLFATAVSKENDDLFRNIFGEEEQTHVPSTVGIRIDSAPLDTFDFNEENGLLISVDKVETDIGDEDKSDGVLVDVGGT